MANLGKKKMYIRQMGITSFDTVVVLLGQKPIGAIPFKQTFRPLVGDTLTIQFMPVPPEEKEEAA